MITLSNNTALPTLNGFAARSTWLIVIAAAVQICTMGGVDLLALLGAMGIGATPEAVVASGEKVVAAWQLVAPIALSVWAWIERRAPNFRLVWPWPGKAAALPLILALALMIATWPALGRAQGRLCAPRADVLDLLEQRYGEVPSAVGMVSTARVELLLAPDGSFTVLLTEGDQSCILASGVAWEVIPPGAPA